MSMIQDCKFVKMVTITINKNLAAWVQFNCDKTIVQKKVMIRGAFDKWTTEQTESLGGPALHTNWA
jgi:hypothetical protein